MNCQCCGKQKNSLTRHDSKLLKGMRLAMCMDTCLSQGHEPRYVVLLAGRSNKDVREHIRKKLYCGKQLTAQEITA